MLWGHSTTTVWTVESILRLVHLRALATDLAAAAKLNALQSGIKKAVVVARFTATLQYIKISHLDTHYLYTAWGSAEQHHLA